MRMAVALCSVLAVTGCHRALPFNPSQHDGPALPDVGVPVDVGAPADLGVPDLGLPDVAPAVPCELTEGNAASWTSQCHVSTCASTSEPCTGSVSDETEPTMVQVGASSVKLSCVGCAFDNMLALSRATGTWDLSAYSQFKFWAYTQTTAVAGWQDEECRVNPWVVLVDAKGRKRGLERLLATQPSPFNTSIDNWIVVDGPLSTPDSTWGVTDQEHGFDLSKVKTIEIHFNPWGYGFSAWIDGLTFLDGAGGQLTGC